MPNGGSDCCGTCWFNLKNKDEAGYNHSRDLEPDICTIRDLPIENPFYTYCGNHPHRRPVRDPIPVGPVFAGVERRLYQPSPDTEDIRQHLLGLLSQMEESPQSEYPIGFYSDEVIVWQVGEFREIRAIEPLRRIASFDPYSTVNDSYGRSRQSLINLALEALDKIEYRSAE